MDSLTQINPNAKIVLVGDFNDDPTDKSVKKVLNANQKIDKEDKSMLYNASVNTFKKGYGTLYYRGAWNLVDQIIISQSLMEDNYENYFYMNNSFGVFSSDYMREPKGDKKGTPLRTFSYGVYKNGFSDHFPTYIIIGKK